MSDIAAALAAQEPNPSGRFTTVGATAPPKSFWVDDEEFLVAPEMPADLMINVAKFTEATGLERVRLIGEFLSGVMLPESAERYLARMKSRERPISIVEASQHAIHLIREVYGVTRPSGQPSSSAAG